MALNTIPPATTTKINNDKQNNEKKGGKQMNPEIALDFTLIVLMIPTLTYGIITFINMIQELLNEMEAAQWEKKEQLN